MTGPDRWSALIGPALNETDVAALLGRSVADVTAGRGLLRWEQHGNPVYPVLQFVPGERRPLPYLPAILDAFGDALLPLTIASWLMTPKRELGGRRPREALLDGDHALVLELAGQIAGAAGSTGTGSPVEHDNKGQE